MPSPYASQSWVDPKVLMAIQDLEMRARVVVEGFWTGLHRSPYHGFSVEFTEYRAYAPGDDIRYLDWRLLARTDRFYLKKFEDETNLRCHLVVDQSRSMDYGTLGWTKASYANTLAATLAHFLFQQGDAVGLLTFEEKMRDYLPARNRAGHLRQLMVLLERGGTARATDLLMPLDQAAAILKKRGLVILISDLLAPLEAVEKKLANLLAQGHEVILFQLLDPAEVNFRFDESALFQDVESGRDLYIDPVLAREEYLVRLRAHNATAERTCAGLGIAYCPLTTDQPLELALFDFLKKRMLFNRVSRKSRARR